MPTDDILPLLAKIIEALSRRPNKFVFFRDLAQQLKGDAAQDALIEGVVRMHQQYFVVARKDDAVKLSETGVRAVAQTNRNADDLTPPRRPPAERRREVIAAVREYARQLRTLRLKVVAVDRGEMVAARYVHVEELSEAINVVFREVRRLAAARADESSLARARSHLRQLQERRRQAVLAHLGRARLVATTVASAFAGRGNLHNARPWTACLLDEASMVSGAITYAVASLSAERVIVAGDPRQLAPVFSWESRENVPAHVKQWLGRDPFEVWGLSTGTGIDRRIHPHDGRLALITTQRRCHPTICGRRMPRSHARSNSLILVSSPRSRTSW